MEKIQYYYYISNIGNKSHNLGKLVSKMTNDTCPNFQIFLFYGVFDNVLEKSYYVCHEDAPNIDVCKSYFSDFKR